VALRKLLPPPPLNVPCPLCNAKVGEQCVFVGAGIVMGGDGMVHQARANLVDVDLKPL
jgi:hypothetical protein